MKLKITMLSIILPSILFAQSINFEAKEFSSDPIVTTESLPFGFKNFVDDSTSKILLIPSKGVKFNKDFVFTNYSPLRDLGTGQSEKDYPSISLMYFRGKQDTKWLFRFDYEQSYSKHIYEDVSFQNPVEINYSENQEQLNENEKNNLLTRFKADFIKKTKSGGYSLGMFLGANHFSNNDFRTNFRTNNSIYESFSSKDSRKTIYDIQNDTESEDFVYSLGTEFTLSEKDWNFASELTFNQTFHKRTDIRYNFETRFDSTFVKDTSDVFILQNYSVNKDFLNVDKKNELSPITVAFKNYYQNSNLNAFDGNASYFIGLDLAYSFGDKSDFRADREQVYIFSQNEELISNDTTVSVSVSDESDFKYKKANFMLGYVIDKKIEDLKILTGLNSEFQFDKTDYTNYSLTFNNNYQLFSYSDRNFRINVQIPLYIKYSPTKWFSVFGILNNGFTYSDTKTESIQNQVDDETEKTISKTTYKNFYMNSALSLGMSLKHKSGLVSHVAFKGDFGEFSNWNISLGYLF